jgi:hypothetical protein
MLLKSSLIRRSCFQVGINESSESWCRTEQSTFQSQKPKNHYMSVQTRRYLVALLLLTLVLLTESRRKFKRKKDNEKFRKNPSKISCCYVIYLFLIITFSIVFPLNSLPYLLHWSVDAPFMNQYTKSWSQTF